MLGAISGDIIGSIYERENIKTKKFNFYEGKNHFTDDSVMTCAVANACVKYLEDKNLDSFKENLIKEMQGLGLSHLNAGYGGNFIYWLFNPIPYNSFGNGSAMRVSPVAWVAETLEETLTLAKISAEVSHNHHEGIKGAQAVAAAIFLLRQGKSKEEIKKYIKEFDVSCQGSVPQALESFFEANSFEDAIRNAISIGGDSDTIAAIAGSLAEACYDIPEYIKDKSMSYLDYSLISSVNSFYEVIYNKTNTRE